MPPLPLSYCTNVHPGRTLAEVERGINDYSAAIQKRAGFPIAAGLWLAQPVVAEILGRKAVPRLAEVLSSQGLLCYTLNTFPYGDFHSDRVKEQVYLPDWSNPARTRYTQSAAEILAGLLPQDREGSLSTVPLGFKGFAHPLDFLDQCIKQLESLARSLHDLFDRTGKRIRLAIEPEPYCVLETIPETIHFFRLLFTRAHDQGWGEIAEEHIGICFDVCHQAVEFEEIPASFAALVSAGIQIVKVHLSSALEIKHPFDNPDAIRALASYAEPRYLHQLLAHTISGRVLRSVDLEPDLCTAPPAALLDALAWRVHFHVPINAQNLGPLGTTREALVEAVRSLPVLPYSPHLEIETYTWEVLPGTGPRTREQIIEGIALEFQSAAELWKHA